MKTFYLLRHEDVHDNTGHGVVAEGIIFDSGMCAMTWLTEHSTITVFPKITVVKKIHGHDGRTEVVIEGKHQKFNDCVEAARTKKSQEKKDQDGKTGNTKIVSGG